MLGPELLDLEAIEAVDISASFINCAKRVLSAKTLPSFDTVMVKVSSSDGSSSVSASIVTILSLISIHAGKLVGSISMSKLQNDYPSALP